MLHIVLLRHKMRNKIIPIFRETASRKFALLIRLLSTSWMHWKWTQTLCEQFDDARIRVTDSYRFNLHAKSNQAGTKISSLHSARLDPLILFVDIRLVRAWLFARTEPAMRERDLVSRLVTATLSGGSGRGTNEETYRNAFIRGNMLTTSVKTWNSIARESC